MNICCGDMAKIRRDFGILDDDENPTTFNGVFAKYCPFCGLIQEWPDKMGTLERDGIRMNLTEVLASLYEITDALKRQRDML